MRTNPNSLHRKGSPAEPGGPAGLFEHSLAADISELRRSIRAGGCDLHMHSRASDGTLSPAELAEAVTRAGLKTVALTDHDTVSGVADMQAELAVLAAAGHAVPRLIPGTELSVYGYGRELHLLGYFVSGDPMALQPYLAEHLVTRMARNRLLCERLQALGYSLTMDELLREAGSRQAGRPHAARLLCRKGYFSSIQSVFDVLLADGRPGYVPRHRPPAAAAIEAIRRAGGIPVLAHPALYGWTRHPADLAVKLAGLQAVGLAGVEVIHGETDRSDSAVIAAAAKMLGLLRTVGSDFHGANKPHVSLIAADADFSPWLGSVGQPGTAGPCPGHPVRTFRPESTPVQERPDPDSTDA